MGTFHEIHLKQNRKDDNDDDLFVCLLFWFSFVFFISHSPFVEIDDGANGDWSVDLTENKIRELK